eukprot:6484342-Amphidinium_carterae.7
MAQMHHYEGASQPIICLAAGQSARRCLLRHTPHPQPWAYSAHRTYSTGVGAIRYKSFWGDPPDTPNTPVSIVLSLDPQPMRTIDPLPGIPLRGLMPSFGLSWGSLCKAHTLELCSNPLQSSHKLDTTPWISCVSVSKACAAGGDIGSQTVGGSLEIAAPANISLLRPWNMSQSSVDFAGSPTTPAGFDDPLQEEAAQMQGTQDLSEPGDEEPAPASGASQGPIRPLGNSHGTDQSTKQSQRYWGSYPDGTKRRHRGGRKAKEAKAARFGSTHWEELPPDEPGSTRTASTVPADSRPTHVPARAATVGPLIRPIVQAHVCALVPIGHCPTRECAQVP